MERMADRRRRLLTLLPHLAILLDERHVSRAAIRAGITQPSMSRMLANARALFGDELLVPSPKGARLTDRGKALKAQIGTILRRVDDTWSPSEFLPARAEGVLKVAATDYAAQVYLPSLVARVRHEAPNVALEVYPWSADALRRIECDELQFGLNPLVEHAPRGFFRRPLGHDRFIVALAAGHPLAKGTFTLRQYLSVPHVLTVTEEGTVGVVDRALGRKQRHVAVRVRDFATALVLVGGSDLIATVPERLALRMRQPLGLALRVPPIMLPKITVDLIWHEARQHDSLATWVRGLKLVPRKDVFPGSEAPPLRASPPVRA